MQAYQLNNTRSKQIRVQTYSLCCFIYDYNIKGTIYFTENMRTTKAEGGEHLPSKKKTLNDRVMYITE